MKRKKYSVVDEETGEVVGKIKRSEIQTRLFFFSVLAACAGIVAAFVADAILYAIIYSAVDMITSVNPLLVWCRVFTHIPAPLSVVFGAYVCKRICGREAPAGGAIALFFIAGSVLSLIKGELDPATGLSCLLSIGAGAYYFLTEKDDRAGSVIRDTLSAVIAAGVAAAIFYFFT